MDICKLEKNPESIHGAIYDEIRENGREWRMEIAAPPSA